PQRKAGQLDNRGSHFYLAMYWAEALSTQSDDAGLAAKFAPLFAVLSKNEAKIMTEIDGTQGSPEDIGGYYFPDDALLTKAMCPSETLNTILKEFK
ncbi:MAG: NADP-dependent isocitrate dehydrogenase, partial [Paraglaciecola polaris]